MVCVPKPYGGVRTCFGSLENQRKYEKGNMSSSGDRRIKVPMGSSEILYIMRRAQCIQPCMSHGKKQGLYKLLSTKFNLKDCHKELKIVLNSYAMQMTLDMLFRDTTPGTVSCYIYDILSTAMTADETIINYEKYWKDYSRRASNYRPHQLKRETTFCGLVMNENGIRPNDKKIQAIQDMAVPRTKEQV